MLDRVKMLTFSGRTRARSTNDPFALPGVDGRSSFGRRYRDIVAVLVVEFGNSDPLRLRELALLRQTLEQSQMRADCTLEAISSLSRTIASKESFLRSTSAKLEGFKK